MAAAIALCLVTSASPALAQPSLGELSLTGPDRIVLGRDDSAELSAHVPGGRTVQFFTNVGTIEALPPDGGLVRARYQPPTNRRPQVAIIVAATDDWQTVDWIRLPLHGQPMVRFSFEPRSRVVVRLGGEEFGPVRTNARGEASIELIVPPGVHEALAVGTDRLGNVREERVPLSPPPFDRVFALCPPGAGLFFALDEDGAPTGSADELTLTVSEGQLAEPRALGPGVFLTGFTIGDDVSGDEVELSGSVPGSADATCRSAIERVGPNALLVSLSKQSTIEGASDVIEVTIRVRFAGDGPRRQVGVPSLGVDFGTIGPPEPAADGSFRAVWTLPPTFGDRQSATIDARLDADIDLSGSADLVLERPREPRAPFALGVQAGFITNFGKVNGPRVTGSFTYALEFGDASALLLGIQAGFWAAWNGGIDQSLTEQVDVTVIAVPILARLGYRHTLGSVDIFGRVNGGTVIANTATASVSTGDNAVTQATWALGGSVGAGVRVGPGVLLLEAGYLHAPVDGDVEGNAAGLHVAAGYDIELGAP